MKLQEQSKDPITQPELATTQTPEQRQRDLMQEATNKGLRIKAIVVIALTVIVVPASLIIAVMFIDKAAPVSAFVAALGFWWLVVAAFQVKIAFKRSSEPNARQPFAGREMLSTKTVQTYARAAEGTNGVVVGWMGPVGRQNFADQSSYTLLGNETVKAAENTLVLLQDQLVCMTLTQSDFDGIDGNGALSGLAQMATVADTASDQKLNVEMLNLKKWPEAMRRITSAGFGSALASHYNFAVPYSNIISVQVKKQFFNPGVYIHINDGKTLKYSTLATDQIDQFVSAAQSLDIKVQE